MAGLDQKWEEEEEEEEGRGVEEMVVLELDAWSLEMTRKALIPRQEGRMVQLSGLDVERKNLELRKERGGEGQAAEMTETKYNYYYLNLSQCLILSS